MKIQQNQNQNVKFTSLQGKLTGELSKYQGEFASFAENYMKDKDGYDVFVKVIDRRKNASKIKIMGKLDLINRASSKKKVSEISSIDDLKKMLVDNYLEAQASKDFFKVIGKICEPFAKFCQF